MSQVTEVIKNHIATSNLKLSTHGVYERYLQKHIAPFFGNINCSELSNGIMQDVAGRLVDGEISSTTAKGIISFLK